MPHLLISDDNAEFYRRIPADTFAHYAELTGFHTGVDIDLLYPQVADAAEVVELGGGYGRAVDFLLEKGFAGEIRIVERCPELSDLLRDRFAERVDIIRGDIRTLQLERPAQVFLWLWSGVTELSLQEQADAIANLERQMAPGGLLVIEAPDKALRVVGTHANEREGYLETEWGGYLRVYLSNDEEVRRMGEAAGLAVTHQRYQSATGLDRVMYFLRKAV